MSGGEAGRLGPTRRSGWGRGGPTRTVRAYFAGLGVAGLIVPFSISVLIWSSSVFTDAGILLAKSWKGASPTPPLASVPT